MKIPSWLVLIFLTILLVGLGLISLGSGSLEISLKNALAILFTNEGDDVLRRVIFDIRLPRILMAMLVGASLALSGYLLQLLVKNPLADPYILGTSTGAALGANLAFAGFLPILIGGFIYSPPILALLGGLITTLLVVGISYRKKVIHPPTLLLAGVGLSSFNTALISLIAYLSEPGAQLKTIIFWIMGSLDRSSMSQVPLLFAVLVPILALLSLGHQHVNALWMEEERANSLGIPVERIKWAVLLSAMVLASLAVSFSGAIGFVGFMIPHFVRSIFGATHKLNFPVTAISGGIFLLLCDLFSRWVYPPVGLPLGIITSFLGIPC